MSEPGQAATTLTLEGMHCGSCVARVKKAIEKVQGVFVDDVRIGAASLRLAGASRDDVVRAIEAAGYRVRMAEEG